ncbi:MAG: hypothetical protein KIT17_03855 [Rubrivivax sp.]|nr:hypothetical protein [Rubrivivax sp.]
MRLGIRRLVDEEGRPLKIDAATEYVDGRSTPESVERRGALVEYLIFPEAWKREVCRGFDHTAVAKALKKLGHLHHERDRLTFKHRLRGLGHVPMYHVKPSIFGE